MTCHHAYQVKRHSGEGNKKVELIGAYTDPIDAHYKSRDEQGYIDDRSLQQEVEVVEVDPYLIMLEALRKIASSKDVYADGLRYDAQQAIEAIGETRNA